MNFARLLQSHIGQSALLFGDLRNETFFFGLLGHLSARVLRLLREDVPITGAFIDVYQYQTNHVPRGLGKSRMA